MPSKRTLPVYRGWWFLPSSSPVFPALRDQKRPCRRHSYFRFFRKWSVQVFLSAQAVFQHKQKATWQNKIKLQEVDAFYSPFQRGRHVKCKPFTSILKRCPSLLSVDLIKSISWMANCQNVKSVVWFRPPFPSILFAPSPRLAGKLLSPRPLRGSLRADATVKASHSNNNEVRDWQDRVWIQQ